MVIGDHYGWFLLDYFLANDFADVITATNAVQIAESLVTNGWLHR